MPDPARCPKCTLRIAGHAYPLEDSDPPRFGVEFRIEGLDNSDIAVKVSLDIAELLKAYLHRIGPEGLTAGTGTPPWNVEGGMQ